MSPVSNAPLFAVNVYVVPSLLVTLTFDPALTWSVFGEKAKPLMVTAPLFARGVDAPAVTTTKLTARNRTAVSAVRRTRTDRVGVKGMLHSMPQSASGCLDHTGHVGVQGADELVGARLLDRELPGLAAVDDLGLELAVHRGEVVLDAVLVLHGDRGPHAHRELVGAVFVRLDGHRCDRRRGLP